MNFVRRSLSLALSYVLFPALLLAFFAVLVAPYFAHAECTASFCPLADVTGSPKLRELYSTDQNLVTYLNTLFKVAISVGAIIAVLRLLYAGYTYMASDVWTSKETAKGIFREVFLGLLLLLSIYIILYQINPNLLNLDVRLAPVTIAPATPSAPSADQQKLNRILEDEQRVRDTLGRLRITVNNERCRTVGQTGCTNVGMLRVTAIGGLQRLKMNCRCSVMVSGGTEFWLHNTHGPNLSIIDLVKDGGGALDRYIQTGSHTVSTTFIRGQSIDVYRIDGGTFYSENSSHWHVVF
ncbi:MAG: hypothetical protein AAB899_01665 [Patescibacteria group bacterium]